MKAHITGRGAITGVRFLRCAVHPDRTAFSWHGEGDDRRPLCPSCLQPINDAALCARLSAEPAAEAAIAALHAAMLAGNDRAAGSARRQLWDWTSPAGVRSVSRHLTRVIAQQAESQDGGVR